MIAYSRFMARVKETRATCHRAANRAKATAATAFQRVNAKLLVMWLVLSGALTPFFLPMVTHAQSASITLDMTPFFTALNTYLPTFVSIFGLIGGIAAALGFAKYIIGTIVNALRGGSFS